MAKVLIGIADANLVSDLSSLMEEMDGFEVRAVARSTAELLDLTARLEPDLVFVDEDLGVEPVTQTIRDLNARRPAMAILQVSAARTSSNVIMAMEAGARGVIAHPLAYEDVSSRVMAATEWSIHMRGILEGATRAVVGRGRVIAVVGAKGGVGTTTIATHLAYDHARNHPEHRVCLVDVDAEKGDVGAILEVRQSVSIADVAKVAGDLSSHAINDAMVEHESGISLLLAPLDVREAEFLTAEALRSIIAMLRREFAVVIIDGGGHVSPPQAAVVEMADDTLVVSTSDVLSIRAMRRRMIAWEALGVREEAAFKLLVNQVDKASLFPVASVSKLTTAQVLDTTIPLSPRVLEKSVNDRDPRAVSEVGWWKLISRIRGELGLEGKAARIDDGATAVAPPERPAKRRRLGRHRDGSAVDPAGERSALDRVASDQAGAPERTLEPAERGGIALENAGIFPIALLLCLVMWQVAVIGFTAVFASHSAAAAAREYSISGSGLEARAAAMSSVPSVFRSGLSLSASGDRVTIKLGIPAAAPSVTGLPQDITTSRKVVQER